MQIIELDSTKILGTVGEPADRSSYTEWLRANMSLYALQNEMTLSTAGTANWIRSSMATNLRKRMTQCNMQWFHSYWCLTPVILTELSPMGRWSWCA